MKEQFECLAAQMRTDNGVNFIFQACAPRSAKILSHAPAMTYVVGFVYELELTLRLSIATPPSELQPLVHRDPERRDDDGEGQAVPA